MKDKLINVIRELVNEELANVTELARPSQKYKIADKAKADKLINIYSKIKDSIELDKFGWIGDMIKIIEKAGDSGILIADLIDNLYKEFKYNKTSQELNPILSRFVEDGITSVGGLSFEPKVKPEPGGAKGRPASEKTLIAKAVDQKLQADNNYQPNEDELSALGAEFIEKLRARVMGTLKRGRPSDPSKAKDGMVKGLKGLMNLGDKDFDGELDVLDDDFEDEDFLQENTLNESFIRMQKIAGLITESEYKKQLSEAAYIDGKPFVPSPRTSPAGRPDSKYTDKEKKILGDIRKNIINNRDYKLTPEEEEVVKKLDFEDNINMLRTNVYHVNKGLKE